MSKWVIGKYIRLSQADRDVMGREGKTESESISHQRALIQNYIDSSAELRDCGQFEFFDDGFSGTSFSRPSFERMMERIKKGEINLVIVKDFSRFGRDYIELGDYLERIFPFLGVRFISVNDGYDSEDYKGTTGGLDVVMKNIVYDFYSKDLSVKVKTAKWQKMKRGEYIGGHVPYGLKRVEGERYRVEPDPEAAEVVREVFQCAIDGMRMTDIARRLNEEGHETPGAYYRRNHPGTKKFANVSALKCWSIENVRAILKQEMYYGAVVGHRREALDVGGKHTVKVPKEEQVIVEGKHKGIVTKEEFLAAQRAFGKSYWKPKAQERSYPLYGKVKCGTCGRAMNHRSYQINGKEYRYFMCLHASFQVENGCCKRYTKEEKLNEAVWESVKKLLDLTDIVAEKAAQRKADAGMNQIGLAKELAELQRQLEKCNADRFANVDLFMAGNLEQDVYQSRRAEPTRQVEDLEGRIRETEGKLHEAETVRDDALGETLTQMKRFEGANGLSREMAEALIEKVVVYDPEHMEIVWKFSDEVMRVIRE